MTMGDWVMIAAVITGPMAAVGITLWYQTRRQEREQKMMLLRHMIAFRQLPADANFSHAVNMVPLEFASHRAVLDAHRAFIASAYKKDAEEGSNDQSQDTAIKQTRLIYEMAHALGFKIRETDLQTEGYTATGFVERDKIFLDAHRAWRDIANLLFIQARQSEGAALNEGEQKFLGIGPEEEGE